MPQAMFGAPIGTMAAQDQERQNLQGSLAALATIGELEQVQGKKALTQAQTGYYEAQTGKLRTAQDDLLLLADYEKAAAAAGSEAASEGRYADHTDVERHMPRSNAAPLQRLYNLMLQKGAPSRMLIPLAEDIAKITSTEALAQERSGQALRHQLTAEQQAAEQVGQFVQMGIDSPQGYAQMRLLAAQPGMNLPPQLKEMLDVLPQDWKRGREVLRPFVVQSMKLKDAVEMKQKEDKLASDLATAATTRARNVAAATQSQARTTLVKEQTSVLKKLGGEGSPTAQAASEALTAARLQTMQKNHLVLYPRAPAEASKRKPGVLYTLPDGRVGKIITGADGGQAVEILPGVSYPKTFTPKSADDIRKRQQRRLSMGDFNADLIDATEEED